MTEKKDSFEQKITTVYVKKKGCSINKDMLNKEDHL